MKKQKNYQTDPVAIYLRITVDGKRVEVSTGRECDPRKWNNKSRRATGTKEDIRSFNAFLGNLQFKVMDTNRLLAERGKQITAEQLRMNYWESVKSPTCL